jgi:hypothetical protein
MSSPATNLPRRPSPNVQPSPLVTAIGWLMALWCVGFAVVNIVLESTDYLAESEYADYAAAFTVMNWLVVGLKLLGAAVALLSVTKRPPFLPPRLLGVMVWGVFATLAVYVLGSMAQALGMLLGLRGNASQIDLAGVAYLVFFLTAATGWGVLAVSYSERHAFGWRTAALGALGAPIVLGLVLVALPILLAALGLMPAS